MSADGRLYIIDIVIGEVKEKVFVNDFGPNTSEAASTIADAKID